MDLQEVLEFLHVRIRLARLVALTMSPDFSNDGSGSCGLLSDPSDVSAHVGPCPPTLMVGHVRRRSDRGGHAVGIAIDKIPCTPDNILHNLIVFLNHRYYTLKNHSRKARTPGMIQRAAPQTLALAEAIIERSGIKKNPYFSQVVSGSMPIEHLRLSQEQFSFAVRYFSRAMSSLVLRIPRYEQRIDILHNVWEEHGEGVFRDSHDSSIRRFLESIGHTYKSYDLEPMWPCTRAFNNTIAAACLIDEIEVGICCMGNIELCFSWISNVIATAVVDRGLVARDNVHHYALHEQIDPRHAEEFFQVVERDFHDPVRRHYIEQGLELGCYAFDRLYRDLSYRA